MVSRATSIPAPVSRSHSSLLYAGIHPQRNRDARGTSSGPKRWNMLRVRVPSGILSPGQYLAFDKLASFTHNQSLRATAGQSIQLHGVQDEHLAEVTEALASAGLAAGCHPGGFEFAIAVSPIPAETDSYLRLRALAADLCQELYPKPHAPCAVHPEHQPRKFTVGLSLPEDNSAGLHAHDAGLLLARDSSGTYHLNVFAGGSLSMPGRRPELYARLASPLGSAPADKALEVVHAIAAVFKRRGQLASRRFTRLKYILDAIGIDAFRAEVEDELGFRFGKMIPMPQLRMPGWSGVHEQGNGRFFYGLCVPSGRIQDTAGSSLKTAIRLIVERFQPAVILAPDQNIIFAGLGIQDIGPLEEILASHGVPGEGGLSSVRFTAMACAGLPTCPMALAESERVLPGLLSALEAELARIGRAGQPFSLRVSGCSIGCIRPNMVDLGVIGRKPGHYDVYLGGSEAEGRFGERYAEAVPFAEIIPLIRPILDAWGRAGDPDEPFHAFYTRCLRAAEPGPRLVAAQVTPARGALEFSLARLGGTAAPARSAAGMG